MEENIIQYISEIERILGKNTKSQSDEFAQGLRYCECIRQELQLAPEKGNPIRVNDGKDFREAIVEVVKYMAFACKNVCAPSEPIEVEWGMKGTRDYEDIKSILPVITLVDRTEY